MYTETLEKTVLNNLESEYLNGILSAVSQIKLLLPEEFTEQQLLDEIKEHKLRSSRLVVFAKGHSLDWNEDSLMKKYLQLLGGVKYRTLLSECNNVYTKSIKKDEIEIMKKALDMYEFLVEDDSVCFVMENGIKFLTQGDAFEIRMNPCNLCQPIVSINKNNNVNEWVITNSKLMEYVLSFWFEDEIKSGIENYSIN